MKVQLFLFIPFLRVDHVAEKFMSNIFWGRAIVTKSGGLNYQGLSEDLVMKDLEAQVVFIAARPWRCDNSVAKSNSNHIPFLVF